MATGPLALAGLIALVLAACASAEPAARSPEAPPPAAPVPVTVASVAPAPPPRPTARPEPTPPAPVAVNAEEPEPVASAPSGASPDEEAPAPASPDDVTGANLRMSSMAADGVQLSDILCRTGGGPIGGIFGGLTVAAGFKARKAPLDACGPKGGVETRVSWTAAGGRMTRVKASGPDAKVNRCVERALNGAPGTLEGTCAATVRHGKP